MTSAGKKKRNGSTAGAGPFAGGHTAAPATRAAFKRGQSVIVKYGEARVLNRVGHYGKGGIVRSRKDWRRGFYEVEIDWDVATSTPVLVSAHLSALAVN